jgi:hypothetical protein
MKEVSCMSWIPVVIPTVSFQTIVFPHISPILLSSPLCLSNNASTSIFNAITDEQHAQIIIRKPYPLYSTLHFTRPHQNSNYRIDTIHWNKRLLVRCWRITCCFNTFSSCCRFYDHVSELFHILWTRFFFQLLQIFMNTFQNCFISYEHASSLSCCKSLLNTFHNCCRFYERVSELFHMLWGRLFFELKIFENVSELLQILWTRFILDHIASW